MLIGNIPLLDVQGVGLQGVSSVHFMTGWRGPGGWGGVIQQEVSGFKGYF